MNHPTPYGKSDDLALENERLIQALRREYEAHTRTQKELGIYKHTLENLKDLLERGELSDEYHTFNELYEARMLYHAHAVSAWLDAGVRVFKSEYHSNGELCFGGGWFIVVAELPTGQVSQHYAIEHWDLFDCLEVIEPPKFDGHTTKDVYWRLRHALEVEQS